MAENFKIVKALNNQQEFCIKIQNTTEPSVFPRIIGPLSHPWPLLTEGWRPAICVTFVLLFLIVPSNPSQQIKY